MTSIGILDLQGGVVEHQAHLERLGVPVVRVKETAQLAGLAGLILPGGESSCLTRLFRRYGWIDAIRERFSAGLKLWGTCAGAILLARRIDGEPAHLSLMDIDIRRNAFGSQLDSFQREAMIAAVSDHPLPLTFIRAPQITRIGDGVRSLLTLDGYHAAAEDAQALVTIFHPELTSDSAFHRYFCHKCGLKTIAKAREPARAPWTQLAPIP
uniref:Pyridoxal 5'-phosphate synthase subunit PdxT n=1 Tax=Candidatus Kentrum sp. MB TaxID=2138164 RepID=A0A451BAY6_9GAMM|nr:MAG: pyridoxal phosphate synthase yaaE subunit [Candidatus Kentron sp. MB]VFK75439.1 MAG: pyridoxal phosphate synthase yaaE subunit [Candidatus Kentron sp. MB]